ncbi:MAG: FHA domain-containing protein [Gammaproteobacteria bacterium]
MDDDRTAARLAVLFADVSGSTRLYEQYGDAVARHDVGLVLRLLGEVAARHHGQVIKTIGDEVMCTFSVPQHAALAAREMHETLREASAAGRFRTGTLRVKIGWHYGSAEWRGHELVGALPVIAQQVIGRAKPEEILASAEAVAALPSTWRDDAQLMDTVESRADGAPLGICKLPWEDDDEATQFRATPAAAPSVSQRLWLRHGDHELCLDEANRHCRIGRIAGNDIVTASRFTSRHHAEISLRQGRFYVADKSINGTLVAPRDGPGVHLHNEEGVLSGEGTLVFGNAAAGDPAATVIYRCE